MPTFSKQEVAKELERRKQESQKRENELKAARDAALKAAADSNCVHCGQPFISYLASAGEHGLCDYCLHKD